MTSVKASPATTSPATTSPATTPPATIAVAGQSGRGTTAFVDSLLRVFSAGANRSGSSVPAAIPTGSSVVRMPPDWSPLSDSKNFADEASYVLPCGIETKVPVYGKLRRPPQHFSILVGYRVFGEDELGAVLSSPTFDYSVWESENEEETKCSSVEERKDPLDVQEALKLSGNATFYMASASATAEASRAWLKAVISDLQRSPLAVFMLRIELTLPCGAQTADPMTLVDLPGNEETDEIVAAKRRDCLAGADAILLLSVQHTLYPGFGEILSRHFFPSAAEPKKIVLVTTPDVRNQLAGEDRKKYRRSVQKGNKIAMRRLFKILYKSRGIKACIHFKQMVFWPGDSAEEDAHKLLSLVKGSRNVLPQKKRIPEEIKPSEDRAKRIRAEA